MKKIIGICTILSFTANLAWTYYQDNTYYPYNYERYPYTENWQYPYQYSGGYPQESYQSRPSQYRSTTTQPQYSKHSQQLAKPFEQQYDNLIVMFTKDQCGYCRYMKPIMKQVEKKFGQDIKFLYVDIVQNPQYPTQYGFSTVPHIVYFKNGKQLDAHGSGNKTMTAEQVEEKIRTLGMAESG